MYIVIVHAKRSAPTLPKDQVVYLDRTIGKSVLSNQWTHLPLNKTRANFKTNTVQEAVEKYEQWLKETVLKEVNQLNKPVGSSLRIVYALGCRLYKDQKTLYLACWCKDELDPRPYDHACHCEVVRRVLAKKFEKEHGDSV